MDRSIDGGNQYPIVSICCTTYNHARFIRQCMDGFLQQKTSFPIEVLIHDDASTDGTQDIIREYEKKYPNIVKPIYQIENQYSKGVKVSLVYNYSRARGKYIALCEGDDYWTDPYKLQKQVDFLESHPDYVMCSHRYNSYKESINKLFYDNSPDYQGEVYDLNYLIHGGWCFQPLSVVYRFDALDRHNYNKCKYSMDAVLFYEILKNGKGFCLPNIMAVYRVHHGGIWSEVGMNRQRMMEFKARLSIYEVERSKEAAIFLLNQFTKLMSRLWMLKHPELFWCVGKILTKYFGLGFTLRLFGNKLFLDKNWKWGSKIFLSQPHNE